MKTAKIEARPVLEENHSFYRASLALCLMSLVIIFSSPMLGINSSVAKAQESDINPNDFNGGGGVFSDDLGDLPLSPAEEREERLDRLEKTRAARDAKAKANKAAAAAEAAAKKAEAEKAKSSESEQLSDRKGEKTMPKEGSLSSFASSGGGSKSFGAAIPSGNTEPWTGEPMSLSGSVSKIGKDRVVAKVFNNSKDKSYSFSAEIRQLGSTGSVVKKDFFSASLKPGQSIERSVSASSNLSGIELNYSGLRTSSTKKAAETEKGEDGKGKNPGAATSASDKSKALPVRPIPVPPASSAVRDESVDTGAHTRGFAPQGKW